MGIITWLVTESQRYDSSHRNGHDHITMESQSQDVTKGLPNGHEDYGRQGA